MQPNKQLDSVCSLLASSKLGTVKLTKIICTIGPASRDVATLEELIDAGMNVARLNLSHGTHEYHIQTIKNIRLAETNYQKKTGVERPIAIALDTRGREIRTGLLEGGDSVEVLLVKGKKIKLTADKYYETRGNANILFVSYQNITGVVKAGDRIFIDDGLISLKCVNVEDICLICQIENDGLLGSRKGVNLPGVNVDLPPLSQADKLDLEFGVSENVDMIFGSFTPNAAAVVEMRRIMGENGKDIRIISKIENQQGIDHADEIIDASDGIMVERGDLGSEIPIQKVFLAQKCLIARCNRVGKPVICATQMLESMTHKPRPTRAEITDVANAVLDGADCVMLSGETARGEYPTKCVAMMTSICMEAEAVFCQKQLFLDLNNEIKSLSGVEAVAAAAVGTSIEEHASAIILSTDTAHLINIVTKFRPGCPIIAVTDSKMETRRFQIYRAVIPVYYQGSISDVEERTRIKFGIDVAKTQRIICQGDRVVAISRSTSGDSVDTMVVS
ncbi:pyruvate kinase-like [Cylas formicarius]|uniref:pyruvate kinase-like n=1 Tax=Cylas formicarius TaxID=197179 RepID=UPI002958940F|nr:pyruvate kinase-like [Cylas formicarius]